MKLKFPVPPPNLAENGILFNNLIWFSILSTKTKISFPNFVGDVVHVFLLALVHFSTHWKVHLIFLLPF